MSIIYNGRDIGALYWNGSPTVGIYNGVKVWPTETGLPPYTIRLKYKAGVTPSFYHGTAVQVSSSPNIWDLTYNNTNWNSLLYHHKDLTEIIDANTSDIIYMYDMCTACTSLTTVSLFDTSNVINLRNMFSECTGLITVPLFDLSKVYNMQSMFYGCSSLTSVPLFNTLEATNMHAMFYGCSSLTSVPLFNTSKATDIGQMFYNCTNVESGALALYRQASSQATPPTNHTDTFKNCGSDTTTGSDELDQIPTDWGGFYIPVNFDDDD